MNSKSTSNPSSFQGEPQAAIPGPDSSQKEHGSLKSRAKRGAIIVIFSQFVGQFLRLASNLVLTRLLILEHFGLMAMVNIVIAGVSMFSDLGIRPSIIQNQRGDDPRFLNTAWTIQVIRGFCVWLVICALAYPMGYWFYDEMPELAVLLPVSGLSAVLMGFQSTKVFTASRHLLLGREMALQIGCNLAGLIMMALLAYLYRSVWALVFGTLLMAALNSAFSHIVFPGPNNRFNWDRESLNELIRFGKWVFMGTVVLFLANNLDRLLLGKLITPGQLGVYSIAFMLASTPSTLIKRFGNKVVFPAISRKAEMPRERMKQMINTNQRRLALVISVPVIVLVCAGDWIITLAWDPRYADAGWMTSILGIGLWLTALRATSQSALLALGKPQYGFYGNLSRVFWSGAMAVLGYHLLGLPGFLLAFALSELPAYVIGAIGTSREKIAMWKQDVVMSLLLLAALAVLLGGRYVLQWGIPFMPPSG